MERWTRTDLAMEAGERLRSDGREIPGVTWMQESSINYGISTTTVIIEDEQGEKAMHKQRGRYVTIESGWLKENHLQAHQEILDVVTQQLKTFLQLRREDTVLIAGLGNRNVTADALGPLVVDHVLVTRHMMDVAPDDLKPKLRSVCAVAPGVMGQTGMETGDILQGITRKLHPDILLVVDALATASVGRMNTTIQISDAGIGPGAGMGNFRQVLSKETLKIPVIAIGVPTVIDAATIVSDTMETVVSRCKQSWDSAFMNELHEELTEMAGDLYVTPKDMDIVSVRVSNLIAGAINRALHGLTHEEMQEYLY